MSTTQLATTRDNQVALKSFFESEKFKAELALALPKHVRPDRFVRVALTAINQNPRILDCTQQSIGLAMLKAAASGLEVGRECHIIPYGKDAQFQPDYKGLASMLRRSGEVADVHADVVREGDEFSYCYGTGSHLKHKPARADRGAVTEVYSYVRFKDGSESFEVMSVDDVNHVRDNFSRGYKLALEYNKKDSPWITSWAAMACKTVFKKHTKWLPLSPELADAIRADDDDVNSGFENARQVNERPPVPEKQKGIAAARSEHPAVDAAKPAEVVEDGAFAAGEAGDDAGAGNNDSPPDSGDQEQNADKNKKARAPRRPRASKSTTEANPAPQDPNPEKGNATTQPTDAAPPPATPPETKPTEAAGGSAEAKPADAPAASAPADTWPRTARGKLVDVIDAASGDATLGYRTEVRDGRTYGVIKRVEIEADNFKGKAYYIGKDINGLKLNEDLLFELARQENADPSRPPSVVITSYRSAIF